MATTPTQNAVPSESPRDLKFNAGKIDEFVNSFVNYYIDRFGNQHYTIEGLKQLAMQAISKYGYITVDSFQAGANLTLPNQVLRDTSNGEYYRWDGAFPKSVPAGSTPQNSGGVGKGAWVSVGDASLRANLAGEDGVKLVNNAVDKRGDTMQRLNITGDGTAAATGNLVVGNLAITPGTDAARDAITVYRKIDNSPTNCHGFADKTWINQASDYGGYGAFDATVLLSGTATHNHVYSFQDRTNYSGSGRLQNMEGLFSSPTITGSGTVENRVGVFVNDAAITNGGKLLQQSGILVEDLFSATTNVGIHVRQTKGLGYYSPNFGKMWQNGVVGFGIDPSQLSTAINFRGEAKGSFYGFATTDNNGTTFGTTGDTKLQFVAGSEVRLQIKTAASNQRAVTPGLDNSASLGDSVTRWSTVFAGTGTINTSDGREKTKPITVEKLSQDMGFDSDLILDAWGDVSLIAFKWLNAIQDKGEDDARWHFGVIAQQVKEAFEAKGIDGTRFGLLCYDEWDDQYDIIPEEVVNHPAEYSSILDTAMKPIVKKEAWTEVVKPESRVLVTPAGDRWGIRADQCLWLEAAYQRRERQRLAERVSKLERLFEDK